jgi:hypothetical protein
MRVGEGGFIRPGNQINIRREEKKLLLLKLQSPLSLHCSRLPQLTAYNLQ